ncbi:tyrosine recombinase XerS [Enterococcus mediterraneensis]|uniref:tyrosine recombinase XerS n=1 Tax=Enterococcus mediterraneensis TaxID=2364791 RepID=UPI000F062351|nr:tyrosine recombinase XerS [Enterococcus mediterraneensis]
MDEERVYECIQEELTNMPDFVAEFVKVKTVGQYSPLTIYEYLKNYRPFFEYLVENKLVAESETAQISIESMRKLTVLELNDYKAFLQTRKPLRSPATERKIDTNEPVKRKAKKSKLSSVTVQRAITALKVLFKFLTESSANKLHKPYLDHNPMNEVKGVAVKMTLQARADKISDYLFLGEQTQEYLDFIETVYPTKISAQARKFYDRDKERDLAINALILYSGLRLSEVVNIDLEDLSFEKNRVRVVRKGAKDDAVYIGAKAMEYLAEYIKIRESRYKPDSEETAFFLSRSGKQAKRMTGSAIEKMVGKYSEVFKIRISPHKMRHTMATRLYLNTLDLTLTAKQLGHKDTSTTTLYTSIANDDTKDALNNL